MMRITAWIWLSAHSRRRPAAARVARERRTSKSPCIAPKPDSTAQMLTRISAGTPNRASTRGSHDRPFSRLWAMATRGGVTTPLT